MAGLVKALSEGTPQMKEVTAGFETWDRTVGPKWQRASQGAVVAHDDGDAGLLLPSRPMLLAAPTARGSGTARAGQRGIASGALAERSVDAVYCPTGSLDHYARQMSGETTMSAANTAARAEKSLVDATPLRRRRGNHHC